jgi:DUF1680 family protein
MSQWPFSRRQFLTRSLLAAAVLDLPAGLAAPLSGPSGVRPIDFAGVDIEDAFWRPKMIEVATVTLHACIYQTEQKSGRIRNFEKAARRSGESHEGIYYDDSDVYKALEAMAYSLKTHPDPALEAKADEWIDKVAAAQLPDGYLNTYFTLRGLDHRWTDMEKHEDYCAGHLIEAGVAYYRTTGKRKLLDVAIRLADHIDATFRIPDRHWVSGHEEIELALVKLYHLTGNDRYLKLADWYLDQRGHGFGRGVIWTEAEKFGPAYCQDVVPVKQQNKITGHAVRAMYLYTGVADVAAITHDAAYLQAMRTVWEDVVYRNMYLTGGIGSSGSNEGFTRDYDLPNSQAYCETCASVGMVFWNQRMALLTGDSKYVDVLERTLYNGALDGLSLSGDRFFYGNPLASMNGEDSGRREWFGTACCPANISRLVASLGGYIFAADAHNLWINLYVCSRTRIETPNGAIDLRVNTRYPLDGRINITVNAARSIRHTLRLRIPGWARDQAVPGDLYRFDPRPDDAAVQIQVNGKPIRFREEQGYAVLERVWAPRDVVELNLPMPVRTVRARAEVRANEACIALQRGPVVYCVEAPDNSGNAWNLIVTDGSSFVAKDAQILNEPIVALEGRAHALVPGGAAVDSIPTAVTAIPYYTWANRASTDMQVWLPTRINSVKINT